MPAMGGSGSDICSLPYRPKPLAYSRQTRLGEREEGGAGGGKWAGGEKEGGAGLGQS